jgi:hypothetical protein
MMTRIALLLATLLCLAVPAYNGYFQNKVSAESFVANGAAGITTVIRLGTCELTIQGGLIVAAQRCR